MAAAINRLVAERNSKLELTAERVLEEIMRLAFVDVSRAFAADGTMLPLHDIPPDVRRAIQSIKTQELKEYQVPVGRITELKFHSKDTALTLLAKNLKLLVDRVEHSGSLEVNDGELKRRLTVLLGVTTSTL